MWKGVTEFLENVDQKAAEFAHKRENDSPGRVNFRDENFDEANTNMCLETDYQPQGHTLPPPPILHSENIGESIDVSGLRDHHANTTAMHINAHKKNDAEIKEKHQQFIALQGDYEAAVAKNRSYAIEVDHLRFCIQELEEKNKKSVLKVEQLENELSDVRATHQANESEVEKWETQCNDQLGLIEEQRREILSYVAQLKKVNEQVTSLQHELSDYKLKCKISLEEKDREISNLLKKKETEFPQVSSQPIVSHNSIDTSETELELRQIELRLKVLSEQLQQKHNSLMKAEEALMTQQLLNAQLKELLEGEQNLRVSGIKSLEEQLLEKQRIIAGLEKKLVQLQTGNCPDLNIGELERKIKELSQLLMEKQTSLETKRAEVDQWRTRYEVSQQRLREAELISTAVSRGSSDGVTRRNPRYTDLGAAEAQEGNSVTKNVLMAQLASRGLIGAKFVDVAEKVDKVSLILGGLLKRHSLLRVFIVCYVVVLQLYVFIIISFSSPIPHGNAHEGVLTK